MIYMILWGGGMEKRLGERGKERYRRGGKGRLCVMENLLFKINYEIM